MTHRSAGALVWLLAAWAASSTALGASLADSPQSKEKTTARPVADRYKPDRFAGRAGAYYKLIWGVDSLNVRWAKGRLVKRGDRVNIVIGQFHADGLVVD